MVATNTVNKAQAGACMTTEDTDEKLVCRIADGDTGALGELMRRHQLQVFRFVARTARNDAIAEEVTNDVFTEVWVNARRFEGRSSVRTWLLSIGHNRLVSRLRKRRDESLDDDTASDIADGADDPEVAAQKADKSAVIRRCVDRLSPAHRQIVDLVYYQEQSIAEISLILEIPEATVKTRMFYARKQLGEALKASGIDRGWP